MLGFCELNLATIRLPAKHIPSKVRPERGPGLVRIDANFFLYRTAYDGLSSSFVCHVSISTHALYTASSVFKNLDGCSKRVTKAFQVCSRDIFVPDNQKEDAFFDRPVPLDHDFNISAPRASSRKIQASMMSSITTHYRSSLRMHDGSAAIFNRIPAFPLSFYTSSLRQVLWHKFSVCNVASFHRHCHDLPTFLSVIQHRVQMTLPGVQMFCICLLHVSQTS
jgi:hypothetical protein